MQEPKQLQLQIAGRVPEVLVVPSAIQTSYSEEQRVWLYSIADFVKLVTERQARLL